MEVDLKQMLALIAERDELRQKLTDSESARELLQSRIFELESIRADTSETECPGAGACHGPMVWCDRCGNVGGVCDFPGCDVHNT